MILAASSHTSSAVGHSSHPFIMSDLAAASFPVTSSNRAEAIHAGGCLGFVSRTDFNNNLAFFTSLE